MKLFTSASAAALPALALGAGYALRLGLLQRRDPFRTRPERAALRRQVARSCRQLRAILVQPHPSKESHHAA